VLHELRISDLGVIDDAVLEPHAGFTVVTGETGAGKTMIVTALGLITGGRGDAARVRAGSERAVVEARLAIDPAGTPASITAAAGGKLDEDGTVIAVRSVGADGRSRAHLGGRSVPLATLSELTDPLIAVHGQSEAISLLRPAQQRSVLDQFAGLDDDLREYRALRAQWQQLAADLADRRARARERAQREQLLRLGLSEITAVSPLPGEDVELIAEARRLENVDGLRTAAEIAVTALSGSEVLADAPNAVGLVQAARHDLESSADPRLIELAGQLQQASVTLVDVAAELAGYLSGLDADPARLQEVLARQAALRTLTRRYGEDVDAVLAWANEAALELENLDSSEHRLAELQTRLDGLRSDVGAAADKMSRRRTEAAERLGRLVTKELEQLAMARAVVRVRVAQRESTQRESGQQDSDAVQVEGRWVTAGPDGVDQVDIVMVAHPGAPELPIAKGASGGELSRVMLALEVVLADADPVATMVFDEVDAGVGGRAASEIGSRLAALARTHQVIVVTHLAQVAAFADRHYVVDASTSGRVGTSDVRVVAGPAREVELARMLGGTDGASAKAHARDLIATAVTPEPPVKPKRRGAAGVRRGAPAARRAAVG
jgi:DNA repair protein RecN (Recombination protein N)